MSYCAVPGCQTSAGCQCNRIGRYSFTPNDPPRNGWMCPQCGCAHAPDVKTCPTASMPRGSEAVIGMTTIGSNERIVFRGRA